MFYSKFLYNQNWNIGFSIDTVESFLTNKKLSKVQWMKHSYRDRFFADPFVLKVKQDKIILLVEELIFTEVKGRIVKLTVDIRTKLLLERIVVLELDTHLSYPAIFKNGDEIYIYPENSAAGSLTLYRFNDESNKISQVKTLINEPLADSTIFYHNGKFWLIATKAPQSQENAYLYSSNSFDGEYSIVCKTPVAIHNCCARPAGNVFKYGNFIYRPAQICVNRYGEGISIQKVNFINSNTYSETTEFTINPKSFKYNLGLHTINFYDKGCVIDGCGYLFPFTGRALNLLRRIKSKFNNQVD